MKRRLVRVVHAREIINLAPPRPGVHALCVTPLANLDGRVNEDFDETLGSHHAAHFVARRAVRTHRRADGDAAVAHDLGRDEADASDVRVAVVPAEAQAFRQVRANHVAVEQRHAATVFEQEHGQNFRGR